jgi:hypothetical protein
MTTQTLYRPNIHLFLSASIISMLVVLYISYGLMSTGTYYDDDIAHYMIARFSWNHPELFFNTWGRPAFTLLYSPAALLGFSTVRVFSAIIAGATCAGGIYLARLYGMRWYWLAAVFIGLQPEFLRQSFSGLTELTFAFIFCIALIAYKKQNWPVMALASGWLPLARYESLPIVLLFALILIRHKKSHLLFFVAGPLLVQNGFWAIKEQNISFLLFPFDKLFGLNPNAGKPDYGTGDAFYYFRLLPVAYGGIGFVLLCYGALREKIGILHLCVLLYIGTLSITYWLMPAAGVAGYVRHLSVISPAVGLLSAIGLEKFFDSLATVFSASVRHRYRVVFFAAKIGIVLSLAFFTVRSVQPFYLAEEQQTVMQAANWFKNSSYKDRLLLGSHAYFRYGIDMDIFDRSVFLPITVRNIYQAPRGSIIVWDSHYSHRLKYKTPLEILQDDKQFRLLQSWNSRDFKMFIYEKLD